MSGRNRRCAKGVHGLFYAIDKSYRYIIERGARGQIRGAYQQPPLLADCERGRSTAVRFGVPCVLREP